MAFTERGGLATTEIVDLLLNATAELILTAGGNERMFAVEVDNTKNSEDIWAKLYIVATGAGAAVGTLPPKHIMYCEAGEIRTKIFGSNDDMGSGHLLSDTVDDDVLIAAVTTAGKGGTTSPPNAVKANIFTD